MYQNEPKLYFIIYLSVRAMLNFTFKYRSNASQSSFSTVTHSDLNQQAQKVSCINGCFWVHTKKRKKKGFLVQSKDIYYTWRESELSISTKKGGILEVPLANPRPKLFTRHNPDQTRQSGKKKKKNHAVFRLYAFAYKKFNLTLVLSHSPIPSKHWCMNN